MTPTDLIAMTLDNVGLGSTTARVDRARQYLNEVAQGIYTWGVPVGNTKEHQPIRWQWAVKEATLTMVAATRSYSLASDVLEPYESFDTTNDRWVPMTYVSRLDHWDPDEDDTGDAERIAVTGRDATTGYWIVDVYPTPDATATIRYRYYAQWVDLTSANDATDLNAKLPEWLQPALRSGISEMYLREKGDLESADIQRRVKEDTVNRAVARNFHSLGQQALRLRRPRRRAEYRVQEGSLS